MQGTRPDARSAYSNGVHNVRMESMCGFKMVKVWVHKDGKSVDRLHSCAVAAMRAVGIVNAAETRYGARGLSTHNPHSSHSAREQGGSAREQRG